MEPVTTRGSETGPSAVISGPLERSEYIEQAYLFGLLADRVVREVPIQESLEQVQWEIAASTRLPMAVQYMLTELRHSGVMSPAMERLPHYFSPLQTYLICEAEREEGRFDMRVALTILQAEAQYRADGASRSGLFFFQFEAICRNRLRYDPGLAAMAQDAAYDADWQRWIRHLRRDIGLIDFADFLFLHSEEYLRKVEAQRRSDPQLQPGPGPFLFSVHEGRIAFACRRRDPLYLFGALQRHLGYPAVPRVKPADRTHEQIPQLYRKIDQLESRLKLLEQEQRSGAIDLSRFYKPNDA